VSARGETRQLIIKLQKQGFVVARNGSGHWKVTRPGRDGMVIIGFSSNSSGHQKTLKRLRELGYQEGGR
jgi:predicted RNA binding protein YcfA (HicA-like mRNA interferase family)